MKKSDKVIFTICLVIISVTIISIIVGFIYGQNTEYVAGADYHWVESKLEGNNLIIYGSLSDSAYVITRYVVEEKGDIMYISIYQSLNAKDKNATSDIYYSYSIPENINKVYLKGARDTFKELWSREK